MATSFPVNPMTQLDPFGFDPQLDYAKVLAEARKHEQTKGSEDHHRRTLGHPDLVGGKSCFSAHFEPVELQKSVENLETKKSWKKSLFFWKKSQKKNRGGLLEMPTSQYLGFKCQCRSKSSSGPIYMINDLRVVPSGSRSSRPLSGPIFCTYQKDDAETPYMPLMHRSCRHRVLPRKSFYMVT